ncbi:amino acid racemase [Demequina sp. SYSU T00039]|uniref:Amino acid racemase n=1 Tax=Demequina lignilytica TaxID=3051663 RepID=A0AAW7M9M9_9MICO|nr:MULTISPECIES: amino acid racemase [unclassified Demequina]MDN4478728.1 amino acid racemase [Demequina sp. SYSU T00039-1]MDN4488705.1 amino acid racemase [Demequina sp. SYSU T00039]
MRTHPRRIGLLGGITWHSTLEYERLLHAGVAAALPGRTADLVIRHYEFGSISESQEAGDWDGLADTFGRDARWLVDGGAEAIVICANTVHLIADQVEAAAGVPVIHIVDEVAAAITASGVDTVALLGTGFTMRMPFYRDRLAARGVTALVPAEPDLSALHALIYDKLARGVVDDAGRALARDVTARLTARGAGGVVAGCTEIPMVMTGDHVDVPYFDALALHAEAAVRFALAD